MKKTVKTIQEAYEKFCNRESSTNEHLPVLKELAKRCNHVTEFGVRCAISTWAFLAAKPNRVVSYDKEECKLDLVYELTKKENVNFEFKHEDVLKANIEETDLLFIDTYHTYEQVSEELRLHSKKVRKYLVFHDIITYGQKGEAEGSRGIVPAIKKFLRINPEWKVVRKYENNNGLLIVERIKKGN